MKEIPIISRRLWQLAGWFLIFLLTGCGRDPSEVKEQEIDPADHKLNVVTTIFPSIMNLSGRIAVSGWI